MQITHEAASLLREVRRAADVPDTYGVRLYPEASNEQGVTVGLGFAEGPAAGDHVTEEEGIAVYVAPEIAAPLAGAVIDAEQQDGEPMLVIRPGDAEGGPERPSANGTEPV